MVQIIDASGETNPTSKPLFWVFCRVAITAAQILSSQAKLILTHPWNYCFHAQLSDHYSFILDIDVVKNE